jgi:hypothetical protein
MLLDRHLSHWYGWNHWCHQNIICILFGGAEDGRPQMIPSSIHPKDRTTTTNPIPYVPLLGTHQDAMETRKGCRTNHSFFVSFWQ